MRYDKKVTFIKELETHYDPDLGEEISDGKRKTTRLAHVTTPSMEKSAVVFGDLKTTDIIVHLKQPFTGTYDYCLINDHKYFFVTQKKVGRRQIIVMNGDSNGR